MAVRIFPKLAEYLNWAKNAAGCRVEPTPDGKGFIVHKPDGSDFIVIPNADPGDLITHADVDYFDRNLGLSSPFSKRP